MRSISDSQLKAHFLAWQCRLRQMSFRDHGGRPSQGMCPRVLDRKGRVLIPAMVTLLIPALPEASTAYFKFQVQRTNDPKARAEAGIAYLGAGHFQDPALVSDELTAVFQPGSESVVAIARAKTVLLDFAQYRQSYRMFATARRLRAGPLREASLWHNRLFNSDLSNDAEVLAFTPEWQSAEADPWPGG